MRETFVSLLLAVFAGCNDSQNDDEGPSSEMTGGVASGPTTSDDSADTVAPPEGSESTSGQSGSTDTGSTMGSSEAGAAGESEEPPGLDPRVSWEHLLEQATLKAAGINPQAELSMIGMTGVGSDGLVDLSDVEADPTIELRFWQAGTDTGVRVWYSLDSFAPDQQEYDPTVTPLSGNGFASPPLWDVNVLPSGTEVAERFAAAPGCDGFDGTSEDRLVIVVDPFTESFVELWLRTEEAMLETTIEGGRFVVPACE